MFVDRDPKKHRDLSVGEDSSVSEDNSVGEDNPHRRARVASDVDERETIQVAVHASKPLFHSAKFTTSPPNVGKIC